MKVCLRRRLLLWMAAAPLLKSVYSASGAVGAQKPFRIFDGTLYTHKPSVRALGIEEIRIVYAGELWANSEDRTALPRESRVAEIARDIALTSENRVAVIDIEHWPWVEHRGDVEQGLRKYRTVLSWFKKYAPFVDFGYYSLPPVPDFDLARADVGSPSFRKWQAQNDRLVSLAEESDILLLSLYAFSPRQEEWVKSAVSHIGEARRYGTGAPVYVFLWPQYHEIARGHALEFLSREFWRLQLETVRENADGVVIWGGWDFQRNKPAMWNDTAAWWLETKLFLGRHVGRR